MPASVFEKPPVDRPFYKRWTVVGGTVLAVLTYLESQQLIPVGIAEDVAELVKHLAALLAGLGVYRRL